VKLQPLESLQLAILDGISQFSSLIADHLTPRSIEFFPDPIPSTRCLELKLRRNMLMIRREHSKFLNY